MVACVCRRGQEKVLRMGHSTGCRLPLYGSSLLSLVRWATTLKRSCSKSAFCVPPFKPPCGNGGREARPHSGPGCPPPGAGERSGVTMAGLRGPAGRPPSHGPRQTAARPCAPLRGDRPGQRRSAAVALRAAPRCRCRLSPRRGPSRCRDVGGAERGCPRWGQAAAAASRSRGSRGSRLRYGRGGGERRVRRVALGRRGRGVPGHPRVRGCAGDGADAAGAPWPGARRRLARVPRGWKGWAQPGPEGTSPPPGAPPGWCWHRPHLFGGCFRALPGLSVSCGQPCTAWHRQHPHLLAHIFWPALCMPRDFYWGHCAGGREVADISWEKLKW